MLVSENPIPFSMSIKKGKFEFPSHPLKTLFVNSFAKPFFIWGYVIYLNLSQCVRLSECTIYPPQYWWYPSTLLNIVYSTEWYPSAVLNIVYSTDGFPPQYRTFFLVRNIFTVLQRCSSRYQYFWNSIWKAKLMTFQILIASSLSLCHA